MIVGKQSLTLKCLVRVFSLKTFLEKLLITISWIMRVYIVLIRYVKRHTQSHQAESFVSHSRLDLNCE